MKFIVFMVRFRVFMWCCVKKLMCSCVCVVIKLEDGVSLLISSFNIVVFLVLFGFMILICEFSCIFRFMFFNRMLFLVYLNVIFDICMIGGDSFFMLGNLKCMLYFVFGGFKIGIFFSFLIFDCVLDDLVVLYWNLLMKVCRWVCWVIWFLYLCLVVFLCFFWVV